METITKECLIEQVKSKEVTGAILNDGRKVRLFISTDGFLCEFKKSSSRRGYVFTDEDKIKTLIYKKRGEKSLAQKVFDELQKYKKLASKASFTNRFVRDCMVERPLEQVIADSDKEYFGLYYYGITTGNKIDGKVITISGIGKKYPQVEKILRDSIKNQIPVEGICYRLPFRGYELTISTRKEDNGDFAGSLSLEYKNCGNGYYYLLINDDCFIGYDVD